ncbi:MAG: hypothetical protein QG670_2667 [Thermoproteota archaeon]|nr:hypothetical protein [Thermoproteota archaeon]
MKSWVWIAVIIFCSILVVGVLFQFYPRSEEQYLAMGILGKNQTANNYFPNGTSTIEPGTIIRWYLYIYNHMVVTKNISMKVKLLNSALPGPNDTSREPSPTPSFLDINQRLAPNETRILPFTFIISEAAVVNASDRYVRIMAIQVNNVTTPVDMTALEDQSFRFVFELWSYDEKLGVYVYSWTSNEGQKPVWIQMWFNLVI